MKDKSVVINPVFEKFLLMGDYAFQYLLRLMSHVLLILFLTDTLVSLLNGKLPVIYSFLAFLLVSIILWVLSKNRLKKSKIDKWDPYLHLSYSFSFLFILVLVLNSLFSLSFLSYYLPNYTVLNLENLPSYLADIALILITSAFFVGMYAVVLDLLNSTVDDFISLKQVTFIKNKSLTVKGLFLVLFFISTFIVFYYLHDFLWIFTLDLLDKSGILAAVINGGLAVYYGRLVLFGLPLKKPSF